MTSNNQFRQELVNLSLERLSQLAKAVLDRLERGEPLSGILSQARLVAEVKGDKAKVYWIDLEMYGLGQIPLRTGPSLRRAQDNNERVGVLLFAELHHVEDYTSTSLRKIENDWGKEKVVERTQVAHQSISSLEESIHNQTPVPGPIYDEETADRVLQLEHMHREHKLVLRRVRDYLYKYVSSVWIWAEEELENQRLLGRDYRIVINNLDALETAFGQELIAALRNLQTDLPAQWSAAALVCRNVILKLGRILFPAPLRSYKSDMLQRNLDFTGDKELNRLKAFIDYHWKNVNLEDKEKLRQLADLAKRIYEKGSQGKKSTELTRPEAQSLTQDTFRLVSGLSKLVGLQPVSPSSEASVL